jgi:hypothetical protein
MRKTLLQAAIATVTLASSFLLQAQETVAITEFLNESNGNDAYCEWIELYNFGTNNVSLSNWTLSDEDSDNVVIPAATIAPGGYLILARDKGRFQSEWLGGIPSSCVVHIGSGAPMGAAGDELILRNSGGAVVWKLAYRDDDTVGRATFLAEDRFSARVFGSKASPGVNRNGNDATGTIGYEGNDHTTDPLAFRGASGDTGSPLAGNYAGSAQAPSQRVIDTAATGQPISPGVRGLAIADNTINRTGYFIGIPDTLEVVTGSALRGVAGGLYADLYDWRVRNNEPRPTTLQFQRYARDHRANLFVTVNTRGLVEPDPLQPGKTRYYTTSPLTLSSLAGDWVRYANRIAGTYRQGDAISDPRDSAIMSSLIWGSAYPGDQFDTLVAPGEPAISPVRYWEIGNEPTVSTSGSIAVSNGYRVEPADFYNRYKLITAAMKAEDPSIKVGPCVVDGSGARERDHLNLLLADHSVPIEFISYHPYQRMGDLDAVEDIEAYLGGIYQNQFTASNTLRDLVTSNGRSAASVELVASEVNVSYWSYNDTPKEGQMAHALGSAETVFTHARLGLTAAHYWIWPAHVGDGTRYPLFKAYEMLRDHMGDTLLDVYTERNALRLYTTLDSATGEIAVWGLNFSNSEDRQVHLRFENQGRVYKPTLKALGDLTKPTTLFSSILSPWQPGGPRYDVGWKTVDVSGADLTDLPVTFKAAELTVLLLTPENRSAAKTDSWCLYE